MDSDERLTSEEIFLKVNNDKLVKKYNLIDMYSVIGDEMPVEYERTCRECGILKRIILFRRNFENTDGYRSPVCTVCLNKRSNERYHSKKKKKR